MLGDSFCEIVWFLSLLYTLFLSGSLDAVSWWRYPASDKDIENINIFEDCDIFNNFWTKVKLSTSGIFV